MITLSPEARLSLILPNTNKALSEAIKNATPEQLETLKEGKDIKSLLTSVFQDKTTASKSDQTLLDLLKNSSAFKNMGSFGETFQSLLKEMKGSGDMAPKAALLESFLKNITALDPQNLKSQIASSGVFMESKFAAALNKIPDLTQNLETLKSLLSKMPTNEAKSLLNNISTLLSSPLLTTASTNAQSALQLSEGIKKITETLQSLITKTDPLYSKEVAALAIKLDSLTTLAETKTALSQLYGILLSSKAPDTNSLLDSIEKLLKNLTAAPVDEIKTFSDQLKHTIQKNDLTADLINLKTTLSEFAHPKELLTEMFLKESMAEDLKSNLLSLHEELSRSSDPASLRLLEHTDKLLTQIDYHQMLSYLSSSNSIYLPFVWDQLQEGSMTFKKTKEKKFYCEIHLKLKEYGELDLMMGLYDENQLEIQAHSEKSSLKTLIQENIGELRSLLIKAGLTPRSIRVFDKSETHSTLHDTYVSSEGSDMGFEVKV
jgi:hypothetical protein